IRRVHHLPAIKPREKIEHCMTGHVGVDTHLTRQIPDPRARLESFTLTIVPQNEGAALSGSQEIEQDTDGRGLPCAVQSEETERLSGGDLQMKIVDSPQAPVSFRDSSNGDHAVSGWGLRAPGVSLGTCNHPSNAARSCATSHARSSCATINGGARRIT